MADCRIHGSLPDTRYEDKTSQYSRSTSSRGSLDMSGRCPELSRAMDSVRYMAECTKQEEESDKVREDWKFVAMVLDRLFLWIFSVAVVGENDIVIF